MHLNVISHHLCGIVLWTSHVHIHTSHILFTELRKVQSKLGTKRLRFTDSSWAVLRALSASAVPWNYKQSQCAYHSLSLSLSLSLSNTQVLPPSIYSSLCVCIPSERPLCCSLPYKYETHTSHHHEQSRQYPVQLNRQVTNTLWSNINDMISDVNQLNH